MKIIKIFILCLICISLNGCRQYGEKRIVKLITVDSDNVSLHYYDYSGDKPSLVAETSENKGTEYTITELLSRNVYDLKLCKYAVCDMDTMVKESEKLYSALVKNKFSPDIVILQGNTKENAEKIIKMKNKNYPLYNYYSDKNGITGIIENLSDTKKNIIIDSGYYKTLDEQQSMIFDALNNNIRKGNFTFVSNEKLLAAEVEGINTFYSVYDNVLNINISAVLKSFKGLSAGEDNKDRMRKLLQETWKKEAELLLEDDRITNEFNMLWYKKTEDFDSINIYVNIL